MGKVEIYQAFVAGFPRRKFSAGLLVAFIDFLLELRSPELGIRGFVAFLDRYPRQETLANGGRANTLVVALPDKTTLSIRPFYNQVELYFRSQNGRFDYPSCAPHATQAWKDYENWLDGLCSMSKADMVQLRDDVCKYVLANLPDQRFNPATARNDPPIFEMVLSSFDMTAQRHEPTGAAYQGIVFGFLRADNPHLQIEVDKVRTGSKRLQRVGDIDGWDGARLAVTAEVKQFVLNEEAVDGLRGFFNETNRRGAIGMVAAIDFEGRARELIREAGLHPVSLANLIEIAGLWDPAKQRIATASLLYYAHHVEKNSTLQTRLNAFLERVNPSTSGGMPSKAGPDRRSAGDGNKAPSNEPKSAVKPKRRRPSAARPARKSSSRR